MKRYNLFLLLFLLLSLFSSYGFAEKAPTIIEVPFYLNGTQIGDVELAIDKVDEERLVCSSVMQILKPLLNKEGLRTLKHMTQGKRYLPANTHHHDIIFSYDEQGQIIFLVVPFKYLRQNKTSLRPDTPVLEIPEEHFLTPTPLSGSIDFSIDSRLYHFYYKEAPSFSDMNLGTNFSLNLKDTLIDGYGYLLNYTGGDVQKITHNLNRGNVTVTRDFVNSNCRLQLGDIAPPSISFQNTLPMVGISLLNMPNLFNRNNTSYSTVGQHEFMLNAPSRVDVYLNNTFLRTLNLPAGPQLIRDFPFAQGVNDVTLKITDPMGNTNELNLETLYAPLKIPPGEFTFDAAVGFPRFQEVSQKFKYLFNQAIVSGILGSGVSDHMTLQAYFQAMRRHSVYCGSTLFYYNKYLQTTFEVGSSLTKGLPAGIRSRFSLSSPNFDRSQLFSWQCNLDFTSRSFSYLGNQEFVNKEKFMFSASVSAKMPSKISTSLTGYYGINRMNFPKVWSLQYTLGKYFRYGSGSVVTSYKQLDNGKKVFEMVFNLNFNPTPSTRMGSNYNTRSRTSNTYASYTKHLNPQESLDVSAGLATASDRKNFAGTFRYQGPRGDAFVNHYLVESAVPPLAQRPKISGTTQVNGRSSFFFADNKLCIGRPTQGSFAIIRPQGIAKKYPLYVNSNSNEVYALKSSLPMGCVFPLGNYRQTSFQVDSYEMPPGFQFKDQLYHVKSKNRSGFVARVDLQAFMCAQGYFIDQEGEPLSYSSGYLTKVDSEDSEKIFFYTNSYGKFYLEGLEKGSYSVHFDQFKSQEALINIKENEEIILLGKIKINLTN